MKILERTVKSGGSPNTNDLWIDDNNQDLQLKVFHNGEWRPLSGGSGSGSGSGCDCPYKAGSPLLIEHMPEDTDEPITGLTKSELAETFGITEQNVDSIFELVRPFVGVYDPLTSGVYNMISLNGYSLEGGKIVVYGSSSSPIAFLYQSGSYGYFVSTPKPVIG